MDRMERLSRNEASEEWSTCMSEMVMQNSFWKKQCNRAMGSAFRRMSGVDLIS